jgi:hypothetical protein
MERAMRLPSALFKIRGLAVLTAVAAAVLGASILLIRDSGTTRTSAPPRPNKGYLIMEGVDINWNRPGHLIPDRPSSGQRLSPPDFQGTGARSER